MVLEAPVSSTNLKGTVPIYHHRHEDERLVRRCHSEGDGVTEGRSGLESDGDEKPMVPAW
jgi:hypothetical protein